METSCPGASFSVYDARKLLPYVHEGFLTEILSRSTPFRSATLELQEWDDIVLRRLSAIQGLSYYPWQGVDVCEASNMLVVTGVQAYVLRKYSMCSLRIRRLLSL